MGSSLELGLMPFTEEHSFWALATRRAIGPVVKFTAGASLKHFGFCNLVVDRTC